LRDRADRLPLQSFITFMDALKLRLRAKDQLHPILQDLVTGYARFKGSKDWEGRSRMVSWYYFRVVAGLCLTMDVQAYHTQCHEGLRRDYRRTITTSTFPPYKCLSYSNFLQLLFDVDHAYAEFFRSLSGGKDDAS
jgi:ESCRT-I complex subunit VPS28